jgi:hypothetical protein
LSAPREGVAAGEIRVGREGGARVGEKERRVGESHEWRRTSSDWLPVEMHFSIILFLFKQSFVFIAGREGGREAVGMV